MAGVTRRWLAVFGMAMLVLLLTPAAVAVAQSEQYPPSPSVEPASAVRARGVDDPAAKSALAFTGSSDTVPIFWIAAGLVVFGGALVFVARQRRGASNQT